MGCSWLVFYVAGGRMSQGSSHYRIWTPLNLLMRFDWGMGCGGVLYWISSSVC